MPRTGPSYQLPYAEAIRDHLVETGAEMRVASVGGITAPAQAEGILAADRVDAVFMAREFLRSPYWPLNATRELDATDQVEWPDPYWAVDPTWSSET